jgi:DNA-binding LacI/PurR family transcriptional regulator
MFAVFCVATHSPLFSLLRMARTPAVKSINHLLMAETLNLSRATVTRSLANHPSISAETREKVLTLATQLGYAASPARAIRRKKLSKNLSIGVLIGVRSPAPGTATFPFILKGIQQHAAFEQANIDVYYQNPDDFDPEGRRHRVFGHMRTANWRGVILIYPFGEAAIQTISRRISTVAVLEDYVSLGVDSIDTDHSAGILALIEKLAQGGHRRIGFAAWHYPIGGHWATRRFAAYVEGLCTHGLEVNMEWSFNVHRAQPRLSREELADAVVHRTRTDRVTAWVCAADHQAYELVKDLAVRGLRVPEDCSVTGYDGIEPPYGMAQVTTVRVPHEDIGAAALARVINRLHNPKAPARKILVGAEFISGHTVIPLNTAVL